LSKMHDRKKGEAVGEQPEKHIHKKHNDKLYQGDDP
jgi:hypothetical protein